MKNFLALNLTLCTVVVLARVSYRPVIQQLCWNDYIDDSTAENLVDTFEHIYGR